MEIYIFSNTIVVSFHWCTSQK